MPSDPTALYEKLLDRLSEDRLEIRGAESVGAGGLVEALRAVVELHHPDDHLGEEVCRGGCRHPWGDPSAWPCPTTVTVAEALGVSLDG